MICNKQHLKINMCAYFYFILVFTHESTFKIEKIIVQLIHPSQLSPHKVARLKHFSKNIFTFMLLVANLANIK